MLCIFALLPGVQAFAFPINFAGFFEKLPHVKFPFSLAEKGHVLTADLKAGEKTYTYSFYLTFILNGDSEQSHRVGIALNRDTPIPLKLTVSRLDGEKEMIIYNKEISLTSASWGTPLFLHNDIDHIKLDPALYRVRLETLAAVPELADIPVNLEISVSGK